jgi:glutamate-1-semialdehyde 2,1-aminomutase
LSDLPIAAGVPLGHDPRVIDRDRVRRLLAAEREAFAAAHPRSAAWARQARGHLVGGVPMSWMAKWAGGFPVVAERAEGARIQDVDGHEYVDFSLGDTGAMAGHAPRATVDAVADRVARGSTLMLPTDDALAAARELGRRFGLPLWQFTLSATDANRFALRLARQVTGRPKLLVFSFCYHGTVDETFVVLEDGHPRSRPGNVGPAVDPTTTTRVVEWNDLAAVERELAHGDVACVLAEPALTNIGIVLPEAGFHADLRDLCSERGTLLAIDETHTLSAGPGGCTAAWGLEPDLVTIGKSIAGGVPVGAYGMTATLAERVAAQEDADYEDVGGIGGTLAGNALSLAATRATLERVLTDEAFARMATLAERFERGVTRAIDARRLPWHVVRLGARVEYRFAPRPHVTGGEAAAAADPELEDALHLFALNRGVLITPFHNMALMSPATTEADVDRHTEVFEAALGALLD